MAGIGDYLDPSNFWSVLQSAGASALGSPAGAPLMAVGALRSPGGYLDPNQTFQLPMPGPSMGDPESQPFINAGNQLAGLAMTGGAPLAVRGALGMAGGKMFGKGPTIPELDAQLAKALEGSEVQPMDLISKWGQENAPQAAKDIWTKREAVIAQADALDAQLEKALKPHKVPLIDIALNPDRLSGLPDKIKSLWAERMRLVGD